MPTPDGREWLTSTEIAKQLGQALLDDDRLPQSLRDTLLAHKAKALTILGDAMIETGYVLEFKVCRLNEALKDAVGSELYGPLSDTEGATPLGMAYLDWQNIYSFAFLANFDEEGNFIGGES